jgi:hypothetical protein
MIARPALAHSVQGLNSDMSATSVTLQIEPSEVKFVLDGLQTLLNCRKYSFTDPDEDGAPLRATIAQLIERVRSQVGDLPKKG